MTSTLFSTLITVAAFLRAGRSVPLTPSEADELAALTDNVAVLYDRDRCAGCGMELALVPAFRDRHVECAVCGTTYETIWCDRHDFGEVQLVARGLGESPEPCAGCIAE